VSDVPLREHFTELLKEIDTRYNQRFIDAEKLTNAAFQASKEAIVKAEVAQNQYNVAHNDLTRKMDLQYKEMTPRTEMQTLERTVMHEIQLVRDAAKELSGKLWLPLIAVGAVAAAVGAAVMKLVFK
jgi:hypothetical protein